MKLLFDHNLSYRLVRSLQREYPDSQHVREVGLSEATDEAVWRHAVEQRLTIVTKGADFHQRSSCLVIRLMLPGYVAAMPQPR